MALKIRQDCKVIDSVTGVTWNVLRCYKSGVTLWHPSHGERSFTWREAYSRLRVVETR